MKTLLFSRLSGLFILLFLCAGSYAQSGGHLALAGVSRVLDNNASSTVQTGWDLRLSGRLGSKLWFFSPELVYRNRSLQPAGWNPWAEGPNIHILQVPLSLGMKVRFLGDQRVFAKAGIVGNYVMIIEENNRHSFDNLKDLYGSYAVTLGYDLYRLTLAYRYEKMLVDTDRFMANSDYAAHSLSIGINF